jgi:hypothetical protein
VVRRNEKQATAKAKAKCGGLSTAAAKAPPPVEMTGSWAVEMTYSCAVEITGSWFLVRNEFEGE